MTPARASRAPLLLAAVISLLLHGLLLAWIVTRPERSPHSPPNTPIEVVVIEVPAAEPQPAPASEAESEPEPKLAPQPPRRRSAPRPRELTEAPPGPSPDEANAPIAQDAPKLDAPVAEAPRTSTGGSWMLPSSRLAEQLESPSDAGVVAEAPGLKGLPSRGAEALVRDIASETAGRGRVERGLVHSWYGELGKALLRTWDADRAVSRRGLSGYFEQAQENSRAWSGIWMEHAAQFGASGNPLHSTDDAPREPERAPPSVSPTLETRKALKKQMRAEFRATKKATVRVVQDATGKLITAELVSPSNDPQVDREALVDVRSAAERLPAPPEEVIAGRERVVSLWQFELIVSITPPVPSVRFEFDEALGFIDPRLPLDRRIYKRVRLLSVE